MSIGLYVDASNLFSAVKKAHSGRIVDYRKYREWIQEAEQDTIEDSYAYGFQVDNLMVRFQNTLRHLGFFTKFKQIDRLTTFTRWDTQMVVDIVDQSPNFGTIVIGSNNEHLTPLLEYLRHKGNRVVIYAALIPQEMKGIAHAWYDIEEETLFEPRIQSAAEVAK